MSKVSPFTLVVKMVIYSTIYLLSCLGIDPFWSEVNF